MSVSEVLGHPIQLPGIALPKKGTKKNHIYRSRNRYGGRTRNHKNGSLVEIPTSSASSANIFDADSAIIFHRGCNGWLVVYKPVSRSNVSKSGQNDRWGKWTWDWGRSIS